MHPHQIATYLDSVFDGKNWLQWDNDTVLLQLKNLEPEEKDKVLAVKAFLSFPHIPASQAVAFEKCVVAFNNDPVIHDQPQVPEIEEVYYAVKQMHRLNGRAVNFGGEVPSYVASVAKYRDVHLLPTELKFARDILNHLIGWGPGNEEFDVLSKASTLAQQVEIIVSEEGITDEVITLFDHAILGPHLRTIVGCILYDPTKENVAARA